MLVLVVRNRNTIREKLYGAKAAYYRWKGNRLTERFKELPEDDPKREKVGPKAAKILLAQLKTLQQRSGTRGPKEK